MMSIGGTARYIALNCHALQTLPEALRETALDLHNEAIHG
jgi:hypothetical protein